jgi:ATP-binding cassette subfamily B protein
MKPLPPRTDGAPPLSWRERVAALRRLPPLFRMVWETNPWLCVCTLVLRLVAALIPIASLVVAKRIINDVVAAIRHQVVPPTDVWKMIGAGFALAVVADALSRMISLVDSLLGDRFTHRLDVMIMRHASSLDLASFEDPLFYDKMERARQQARARLGMLVSVAAMARQTVTLITMMLAVAAFSYWLLVLLAVSTVPVFLGETKFAFLNYSLLFRQTPAKRELDYLRYLGASRQSAKEVKIFGLGDYLGERFKSIFESFYEDNRRLAIHRAMHGTLVGVVPSIAYYAAYAYIVLQALHGLVTVGGLSLIASAFSRSRDIMENLVNQFVDASEQALYLRDLFEFLEARPTLVSGSRPVPQVIRTGFEFRNVSFAYPGSAKKVIAGLSFSLRPGQKIALVGENGAGKTTITKLMARLYDPTEGQILLDGIDLREYDADGLRDEIGVLFQDYMRYDMSVSLNIGFGKVAQLEDRARIARSAEKSLAAGVIDQLPQRYEQMLGRRFEGGTDLSTGQWQKVALARAYMRDAQILILDEPTASLDARAEYEAYERFVQLSEGKMAVLISHRFSTVRMAGQILVLDEGRLVESGSHAELVARGGKYAGLFELQAAGYR